MAKSKHPYLRDLDREIHLSIKSHSHYFNRQATTKGKADRQPSSGTARQVPQGSPAKRWWQQKKRLVLLLILIAMGIAIAVYLNILVTTQLG